ncbi:MAG: hypothetical protein Q9218_008104, partial [Villophora microphyllina]
IQVEKGARITTFNHDDIKKLFTSLCDDGKRYPKDKHEDHDKVRYVANARPAIGVEGKYDQVRCENNFGHILDNCGNFGGEYGADETIYWLYAFIMP